MTVNFDALNRQYETQALDRHLATGDREERMDKIIMDIKGICEALEPGSMPTKQSCGNCRKRWEPTCPVFKNERRRPGDNDWCYGWRRKR